MSKLLRYSLLGFLAFVFSSTAGAADTSSEPSDEETLHSAGLDGDAPALLAFFRARARTEIDKDHLRALLRQFVADSNEERSLATAEFLGMGPLAVPSLRRIANDVSAPEAAKRAAHCLRWVQGVSAAALPPAAARILVQSGSESAAAALLTYLPYADNSDVLSAITAALASVAAPDGKPDPTLLRGLDDPSAARRAAAGVALCRAAPPDRVPGVRKLLHDPARGVRLRSALALAEAHDAEAVPVLIDLLAELPAEKRQQVEKLLRQLAGEWAPAVNFQGEGPIARKVRRDAWMVWWKNVDGRSLLSALRKRTRTDEDREAIGELLVKLTAHDFATRETAAKKLLAFGRRALPQLREAAKEKDPEKVHRAGVLIERIEEAPSHHLPTAVVRLLAVRKPAGSVAALFAYLPFVESDNLKSEVQSALAALAVHDGGLDPFLLRSLADAKPELRAVAAEALVKGGGEEGRAAARKLFADKVLVVRMRVALALAMARQRDGVPVLIDLLPVLSAEHVGQVEDALYQLAGDTAPNVSLGTEAADKKKCRDAWAAWWKVNAKRVDLARLTKHVMLGFTLICDQGGGRVYEIDRSGKERWSIHGLAGPADAVVTPGKHVLIAEYNTRRVTERDFKGKIIWSKQLRDNPVNVQRLKNGNTFIATDSFVVEVDRTGKELYTINNIPGVFAAYRTRKGPIVCLSNGGQCLIVDTTGKRLHTFASGHNQQNMAGLDLLPNGRILVTQTNRGKVVEFDATGKSLLEVNAPGVRTATALANGHILVASQGNQRIYELDRGGKIVWEHKSAGQVVRARRR